MPKFHLFFDWEEMPTITIFSLSVKSKSPNLLPGVESWTMINSPIGLLTQHLFWRNHWIFPIHLLHLQFLSPLCFPLNSPPMSLDTLSFRPSPDGFSWWFRCHKHVVLQHTFQGQRFPLGLLVSAHQQTHDHSYHPVQAVYCHSQVAHLFQHISLDAICPLQMEISPEHVEEHVEVSPGHPPELLGLSQLSFDLTQTFVPMCPLQVPFLLV